MEGQKKYTINNSVSDAKKIIADIYSLTGRHKGGAEQELNKATDAMYSYIKTIKQLTINNQ